MDVDTSLNVGKPGLSVNIDRLKAAELGVQISDAAAALRLLVGGDQVTTYNKGGEQCEVHIRALLGNRQSPEAIGQLTVTRRSLRAAAAAATSVMLILWASTGSAQTQAPASPQAIGTEGPVLHISRDEAVKLALENNPELAVSRFDPQISEARVEAARSVFAPTIETAVQRNSQLQPPTNLFASASGIQTGIWSTNVSFNQLLPKGGGSYSVGWDSSRTTTNSLITGFNPALSARLQFAFSQPLLRNFHIDPLRGEIELSQRNREIADTRLREAAATTRADAERAYWLLVSALGQLDVQQRALDLALELERTNKARVDVGTSPPLDLVAARAEVAQRRENLIVARTTARQAQDLLRTLIMDPKRNDFWTVQIEPADRVPIVGPPPDVNAAVARALAERADLVRVRKDIENSETTVALSKNDALPDLRVQANYLTDAAGGNRLIRSGGFPGIITGFEPTRFGSVLAQVFSADYPTWTVGLTFSYPLGKSVAEANLARARIERDQAAARLRSAEVSVVREVRDAANLVEQNMQRIEAARLGRELAEQRLDAEQKRFEVGMSTSFLVIQAQRDLAVARNNEQQTFLDYQLAVIAFETAQQSGGAAQVR